MIKVGLGFIIDLLHNRNRFFASPEQFVKLRMCHYLKSELRLASDITFDENQGIYLGRMHGYVLFAKKSLGM